jgi:hypothetical protein
MPDYLHYATYLLCLAPLAFYARRFMRTRAALQEPVGGDACPACSSGDVTESAPQCYQCPACRFVWGDGLARQAAREQAAKLAALSPVQRRAVAVQELVRADERLIEAEAVLAHATRQLLGDVLVGGGEGAFGQVDAFTRTRNDGVLKAFAEMKLAQRNMKNAAMALDGLGESREEVRVHAGLIGFDTFFASSLGDFAGHMQAERLAGQVQRMRAEVAGARAAIA